MDMMIDWKFQPIMGVMRSCTFFIKNILIDDVVLDILLGAMA